MANAANSVKRSLYVRDLNAHLVCALCSGYFRQAHTIPECLHTFCKSCLFKSFSRRSIKEAKSCPTCKTNLGLNPYQKVVYDRNLQALVDKIFPHYAIEDKRLEVKLNGDEYGSTLNYPDGDDEHDHEQQHEHATGTSSGGGGVEGASGASNKRQKVDKAKLLEGDGLTLRVVPHISTSAASPSSSSISSAKQTADRQLLPQLVKPLLRVCSKTVTLDKIQRFIYKRLNCPPEFNANDIELLRDGILLDDSKPVAQYPDRPPDAVVVLTYRRLVS